MEVALVVLTFALAARAQDPTAEVLFQRGRELMARDQVAAACPLFAESYRLEPAGGTLQNLAVCHELVGRWATAHASFVELRNLSSPSGRFPRPDRVALANEHIARLAPRVSSVVIDVSRVGSTPITVTIDDREYNRVAFESGVVLDPGDHRVVVAAPGTKPWMSSLVVGPEPRGQRLALVVPPLDRVAPPTNVAPSPTRPPTGLVVGGAGVLSLGAGVAFALLARGANEAGKERCAASATRAADPTEYDASGRCLEGSRALEEANDDKDRARLFANVANVMIPVGAVLVAVGTYLFLTPPRARAQLAPGSRGVFFSGTF